VRVARNSDQIVLEEYVQ